MPVIKIKSELLGNAVKRAVNFVSTKTTHDILKNIMLRTDGNNLEIKSTDLEKSFTTRIECESAEPAEFLIDAKLFKNIVDKLPPCDIKIVNETNKLIITNNVSKSKFTLSLLPVTDFPELPDVKEADKVLEISGDILKESLNAVIYCSSKETSRYFLNSVYVDNGFSTVCTDGRRMSKKDNNIDCEAGWLLPSDFSATLINTLIGGNVSICKKDNQIFFECGNDVYSTGLIQGNFPDYKKVIPTEHNIELSVNVQELKTKISRVMTTVDSRTSQIVFGLSGKSLTLLARNESGESVDELELSDSYEDFAAGMNGTYLLETLSRIKEDNVNIKILDEKTAIILYDSYGFHLIMPMKIQEVKQ